MVMEKDGGQKIHVNGKRISVLRKVLEASKYRWKKNNQMPRITVSQIQKVLTQSI
jgi:hypothetical protein